MRFSRRLCLSLLSGLLTLSASAEQQLNILNWSELLPQATIDHFAAQKNITLHYDMLDNDDVLETKLLAGQSGYDVVYPSSSYMIRQVQAGAYAKIDWNQIPNRRYLDAELMKKLQIHDTGNQYGVPFLWGTDGILINVDKVKKVLGKNINLDSWDLLFKPEYVSKLKACGVSFLDSPSEVFSLMMAYLGRDANSEKPEDLHAAYEHLKKIRPFVTQVNSTYRDAFAAGDICIAMAWSGDAGMVKRIARENGSTLNSYYAIPKGQTPIWFTMMGIPKDAPNKTAAHAWINYLLDPAVAAAAANYNYYPTAVAAARSKIDAPITADKHIYPDSENIKDFIVFAPIGNDAAKLISDYWTRLWAGN